MKIVIIGYGEMFSSLIAGVLNSGHEIVGVFRHENILYPPFSRFLHDLLIPSEDRIFSHSLGLYDIKARSVNSDKFRKEIQRLNADVIIVGSWSEKFSIKTMKTPKIACINTHPSLLPFFRGPNPYIQVILSGNKQSGITFHLMDENYDTGKILYQVPVIVDEEETGISLKLKCCELVRKEIRTLLKNLEERLNNSVVQNEEISSYQRQITIKESILDFEKESSSQIHKRIRALTPWLKCHIPYNDEFFEFDKYKITDNIVNEPSGTIISKTDNSISIVCADKRVIEFYSLKLKRPVLCLFSTLYIKYFVKIKSKAL